MKTFTIKITPARELDRKIRREMPPPSKTFKDKNRYSRKQKHKDRGE